MNRCAAQGKPFLFGVDFGLREGFFVENPLVCRQIPFACGEITNVSDSFSGEAEITPRLAVLHTDREAYLRRFAVDVYKRQVGSCEKLRGFANETRSADIRMGQPGR